MAGVTLSVGFPNFGAWAAGDWSALVGLARVADEHGVDRIVVNDHVVMGEHTEAYVWGRFPTPPEGPWLEPLTVLTAMAAGTQRVRLATGVLIAPLRPAALLAKAVATLDVLSGGRVDLGVGVGWQREEYEAQGLDFSRRGRLLEDTIGACRALWSQLPTSYRSATVSFDGIYCSPQPVQRRLPVWLAGTLNTRNLRRISEFGDGWIPIMGSTIDDVRAGAARLRQDVGRPVSIQAALPVVTGPDGSREPAATLSAAPAWLEAGATDLYVHLAAFAPSPADAPAALAAIADAFRKAIR